MKYFSIAEIRDLELNSGRNAADLMERAGRSAATYIMKQYVLADHSKICIVCGKGNNAGDGFVVARYLKEAGYDVAFVLVEVASYVEPTKTNWLQVSMLPTVSLKQAKQARELIMGADLIIDAMLGIGFVGEIKGDYKDAVCALNLSGKPLIAIDIPTGVHGDTGVSSPWFIRPQETLTFIGPKQAMQCKNPEFIFGKITVIDIGI